MRTLAAAVALLALGGTAAAQPAYGPPPAPPPTRGNIILGGGLGVGTFAVQVGDEEAEEYDESFAYELRFGGMITPTLGLGVELFGLNQDDAAPDDTGEEFDVFQRNIGAWIRWWAMPRLWLQGGIASARVGARSETFDDVSYKGVGISGAVGFEILHAPKYALDIDLRLAAAGYDTESELGDDLKTQSASFGLAFNWFF
ncbi:MAG TPA: outer membrane beta-barrel protein [Kofleriaceae bacterium]|nr:outer membrane beta-barrel protein [Kofleriaceae bacterium]